VIGAFVHTCVIPSGDLAGNKYRQEVTSWDVESGTSCDVCGDKLATPEQIAIHVYREMVG
jgi:hypothetical protein